MYKYVHTCGGYRIAPDDQVNPGHAMVTCNQGILEHTCMVVLTWAHLRGN